MSFAAFIVAVAFVLFGIAMAVGTMTTNRTTGAPPPETVSADPAPSEMVPPVEAAVTQPVEETSANADVQDDSIDQIDQQQAVQVPAEQVATAVELPKSANQPASSVAGAPVVTHDPSFPARRAPPPASIVAPANTVASLVKPK